MYTSVSPCIMYEYSVFYAGEPIIMKLLLGVYAGIIVLMLLIAWVNDSR